MTQQELPILMQGEMVRATERGDKTETRRITGLGRANECPGDAIVFPNVSGGWSIETSAGLFSVKCPYGTPGTRLWLREAHHLDVMPLEVARRQHEDVMSPSPVYYKADTVLHGDMCIGDELPADAGWKWRPSIFMPRWASRYTLLNREVTSERLQDITDDACFREGIDTEGEVYNEGEKLQSAGSPVAPERYTFTTLWDSINAAPKPIMVNKKISHYVSYPWENIFDVREHRGKKWFVRGNPHVWCVKYKMLDQETLEG